MRTCGNCCLCCNLLGVKELEKPARQWCQHCNIGVGCKIYDERPHSCHEFSCLWLTHSNTPEEMKPCISGVVVWATTERKIIALTRAHDPTAWRKPAVLGVLQNLARGGYEVFAFSGNRAWAIGPDRDEELPRASVGLGTFTVSADVRQRMVA